MRLRSLAGSMSAHCSHISSVMTIFETEKARKFLHQTDDYYPLPCSSVYRPCSYFVI